jgi:hypothetical protein
VRSAKPSLSMVAALALLAALGTSLAFTASAEAQEWKIYLLGRANPIDASFYSEEAPWVFFRDDNSMYVFAVGCNRIVRVERGGTAIPLPACPVERVPSNASNVFISVLELEGKRLDDGFEKLRNITVAFNRAAADATIAMSNRAAAAEGVPPATFTETLRTLNEQIAETRADVDESLRRTDALRRAIEEHRQNERTMLARPRYFFAPR